MMVDHQDDAAAWLTTVAGFAAGALVTWLIAGSVQRLRLRTGPVSDDIVLRRVRGRVFEILSEPEAVEITVENGVVRLAGEVPAGERDELLTQLVHMPGVLRLRNALAANP